MSRCEKCGGEIETGVRPKGPGTPLYHTRCFATCRIEGCDAPANYANRTLCDSHKGIGSTPKKLTMLDEAGAIR